MSGPCPSQTRGGTPTPARTASEQSLSTRAELIKSSDTAADLRMSSATTRSSSVSSKQAYMTEFVKALFGDAAGGPVGDVVEDFSCSFQRQAGRLYISTEGLFFYSNLFGFEKKIILFYNQAVEIATKRTTSLSVTTTNGEEYVFRSFENREHVLEIILGYHSNRGGANNTASIPPATASPSIEEVWSLPIDKSADELNNDNLVDDISRPAPEPSNSFQFNISEKIYPKEKIEPEGQSSETESEDEMDETRWKELEQLAKGWDSAIANVKLSCKSSQSFFDLFLKEDATNSLLIFHRDIIGDKKISIGEWQSDTAGGTSFSRKIEYEHKSAVSIAQVTRQQTYQRYGRNACLKNVTNIRGIKGLPSETFYVVDKWFIENTGKEGGVLLSVKFHVNFIKSTMLKSIIKSRATAETTEFYRQYSLFIRQKMHQKIPIEEEISPAATPEKTNWVEILLSIARQQIMPFLSALSQNPLMLFVLILTIMIYHLKQRVLVLEGVVEEFEHRLLELERSRFDLQLPTIEMPLN